MKSAYISRLIDSEPSKVKSLLGVGQVFVIGVAEDECSLDELVRIHPQIQIVTRFPEVINPKYLRNYIYEEEGDREEPDWCSHVLQPAFIQWKE